jgi:hypothetical protein
MTMRLNTRAVIAVALSLTLTLTLLGGSGCNLEPSVSGTPTYAADVRPILASRCVRCHDDPPLAGAPLGVRFDVFTCGPADASITNCLLAVKDLAGMISTRVNLASGVFGRMPQAPAAPLSPYQIDTITRWAAEIPPLEQ